MTILPLFVGGVPGGMELAVILLIAVLLFGANKIPKLARSTGQAMGEFKKGREEIEQELQEAANPDSEPEPDTTANTDTDTDTGTEAETETESSTDRSDSTNA